MQISIQQIFYEIAILIFSVSFGNYFLRTIKEWPLSNRFIRYIHRLGTGYKYGKSEIFYSFSVTWVVYMAGIISFAFSLLEFTELAEPVLTLSTLEYPRLFAISLCLISYLLIPSFLFHITRGILQLIPSTALDFKKYIESYAKFDTSETQKDAEVGIRRDSAKIICKEIEKRVYFNRVLRVLESLAITIFLYVLPWVATVILNIRIVIN